MVVVLVDCTDCLLGDAVLVILEVEEDTAVVTGGHGFSRVECGRADGIFGADLAVGFKNPLRNRNTTMVWYIKPPLSPCFTFDLLRACTLSVFG